jgi:hypothetical protein
MGARRVPYRLPELVAACAAGKTVWVVEGEKDVETLRGLGLTATCNPGGAGKWRPEYAAHFKGAAAVHIIPDDDAPGREHAAAVATALASTVKTVKVVRLPSGKDVTDWVRGGRHRRAARGARREGGDAACRQVTRRTRASAEHRDAARGAAASSVPHLRGRRPRRHASRTCRYAGRAGRDGEVQGSHRSLDRCRDGRPMVRRLAVRTRSRAAGAGRGRPGRDAPPTALRAVRLLRLPAERRRQQPHGDACSRRRLRAHVRGRGRFGVRCRRQRESASCASC